MKKIIIGLLCFVAIASCKKDETIPNGTNRCEHCVQITADSATGTVLKVDDGGSASTYCDNILDNVKSQPDNYYHNTIQYNGTVSTTQRRYWSCN